MLSLERIVAMLKKEFLQMRRDISCFLIAIVLPLLLLIIYGYGVSLDIHHMPIGILNNDNTRESRDFVASFSHSPFFKVFNSESEEELKEWVTAGKIRGFIIVPTYFSSFHKNDDKKAPIQVVADGSEPNTASFIQNYVKGVFLNWKERNRISNKAKVPSYIVSEPRYWYNQELISRDFLLPGAIAIIMTLIGTLLTALVVSREWERGTMESLMTTPITIYELIIGKIVPYYLLGMVSMTLCVAVSIFYYDVPFRGSLFLLFITSSSYLISALALGLLISTIAKNQFVAAQAAIVAGFLPGFILSGFIFENGSMPLIIQGITYLFPVRYFVTCLQSLFLVGDVHPLLILNLIPMWLLTIFLISVTLKKSVKRLD